MDKRKKKKILIASVSVIVVLLIVTTIYGLTKIPPDFERLSDEKVLEYVKSDKPSTLDADRLVKLGQRLEKVPPEKRREVMGTLSEEERSNSRENRRLIADAALTRTIDEFFSLPADKQDEFLDKQIQKMDERMRGFSQRFRGPGGMTGGFPVMSREGGETRPDSAIVRGGGGGGERGQFQSGNRGPGGRGRPSPEAMLQRRRDRLSAVSPEDRAKRREYFRRLMERRMASRSRG